MHAVNYKPWSHFDKKKEIILGYTYVNPEQYADMQQKFGANKQGLKVATVLNVQTRTRRLGESGMAKSPILDKFNIPKKAGLQYS